MLLTFEQTANKLNISRVTLYRIIERGDLKPAVVIVFGKQRRSYFHENEVDTLAKQRNPQLALDLVTH